MARMRTSRELPPFSARETCNMSTARKRQAACYNKRAKQLTRRCTMKSLTPWRPMRELETFERRMADLFDRFWGPWERERSVWGPENWAPAIESKVENGNLI